MDYEGRTGGGGRMVEFPDSANIQVAFAASRFFKIVVDARRHRSILTTSPSQAMLSAPARPKAGSPQTAANCGIRGGEACATLDHSAADIQPASLPVRSRLVKPSQGQSSMGWCHQACPLGFLPYPILINPREFRFIQSARIVSPRSCRGC